MTDVFVSYSRRDKVFVEKLVTALVQDGRDVWIDWEDIPRAADWLNEIDKGIENATTFVFVVSTYSLTSEICNHELAYALKLNKRVVPLIREDITGDTDTMVKGTWVGKSWSDQATTNWTAVGHLNWIFFNNDDEDKFKTEFQALLDTLDADLDHIKTHTRILVREREWEENQRNPSYLLGGEEITEAEAWLKAAESGNKNPPPTDMHSAYILKSRVAEDERLENLRRLETRTRQFRTAAAVLGVAIIGAIIAVVFAVNESQRAQNNSATAVAVADVAEQNAADANATLTPIQSTLTRAADDIVLANAQVADAEQQVSDANATLSPIPPTLTQAAGDIQIANESLSEAETQVADANATLQPIPPTLTQAAGDINTANENLALAETQVSDVNATLQPIPPTLTQSAEDIALAADAVSTAQIQVENAESELTSIPPTLEALDSQIAEAEERVEALNLASRALSLGNAATERLNENSIELAALLAIRSLRIDYNSAADSTLVRASSRLYTDTLITTDVFPSSTAFHADDNLMVVGMEDGAVFFYEADTGELLSINDDEHGDSVTIMGFVPDSTTLISGDFEGNIVFWDAEDADPQETIEVDAGVLSMDFDEDAERLAVGLDNGEICIIDLDDEEVAFCFQTDEEMIRAVAFGPDDMLVSNFYEGVDIWELESEDAEFIRDYVELHDRTVNAIDVSADGEHIMTAASDTKIILWEAETGEITRIFDDNTSDVTHVRFTEDEQFFYSASWDGIPRLWSVETGEVLRAFGGHTSIILGMGISEGSDQFVTTSEDSTVRLWDANIEFSRGVYRGHDDWVTNLAFSDDGQYLVSAGDQQLRVWDLISQTQVGFFEDGYETVGVTFLPDSIDILFDLDGNLAIWDFEADDIDTDEVELPAAGERLRVTNDGEYFVYQSFITNEEGVPRYIGFGEVGDDDLELLVDTDEDLITGFDVALDENIVVWIENFETLVMYDLDDEEIVNRLRLDTPEQLWWVAISPDATLLMFGNEGSIFFVDANTGDILATFEDAHSAPTRSMRISPDGQWGVSTSEDQSVILWNLTTLSQERVYTNHSGWVLDAVFSPDSSLVASSGVDETVQVWTVSVEDLIADVCSELARDLTADERIRFNIIDDEATCQ